MPTLRLTQRSEGQNRYHIQIALEVEGQSLQTANVSFDFAMKPQEREDMRWYLEDYLQYLHDPAQKIAERIQERMTEIGTELFENIFQRNDDARIMWTGLCSRLNDTQVEIVTDVQGATAIPWELIHDPRTETFLALTARAFVRAYHQAVQAPRLPATTPGPIRILLVICRPGGRQDVPFRSVAIRIVKGLNEEARVQYQLDVLRPPTFEQLGLELRRAIDRGEPYHVVHFDGHGTYADMERPGHLEEIVSGLSKLLLSGQRRPGEHGYLLFENPSIDENAQLVDGPSLGRLLVETKVPILVLNACRSAYARSPDSPHLAENVEEMDPHSRVRAFGSLAQEVMDAGVAGVVAMSYNVYVVTAAQFVADFYAALTRGLTLGEAATLGRKQLHDQPLREIAYVLHKREMAYVLHKIQDWPVPVVYGAAQVSIFPRQEVGKVPVIELPEAGAAPQQGMLDPNLPPTPDIGFFGRDETLLALDRSFDSQKIILLHAYAGSGKTATAAEFARWYSLTGGVKGRVLFTSFERYNPLKRVLDRIGQVFGNALEVAGVNWLALNDAQRRDVALQLLRQVPVLWIWDNVQEVAGFPSGSKSAWGEDEQRELADFLQAARETRARFLLTSRRDEKEWLFGLPGRIEVPPMPMQDRVELARSLAEKHGRRIIEVEDWMPLMEFTQGNPLTITVLVGQALRDGLRTKDEIERFVADLRAGEAAFEDEESEGRSRLLGASLSYGFEHAFIEDERKKLALLRFFQGFVDVDVLMVMGHPEVPWSLSEVRGLTREEGIELLDRAAEVGLLTGLGGGYYVIHPALPWYFRSLFKQHYAGSEEKAARAFVEAVGGRGDYYHNQYVDGNREVINVLAAEEANLLYAREMALKNDWWGCVISAMQGLRVLYGQTGCRVEWAQLVEDIVPEFVDTETDGPLQDREESWSLVTEYRVRLAREAREWEKAQGLQRISVDWDRQRADSALAADPEKLDGADRNAIRTLAASLHELGEILREQGLAECVNSYEEALALAEKIGDQAGAAVCAFNLGTVYVDIAEIRVLDQAERWYRHSLELYAEGDRLGRGRCLGQRGYVALRRFKEARTAGEAEEVLLGHLSESLDFYNQDLDLVPSNAVNDLAVVHNALGYIYDSVGGLERALQHYRDAVRYYEAADDLYGVAKNHYNIALVLARAGRFPDALEYARAALHNYETFGDGAAADIQDTQNRIALIEKDLKSQ